MHGLHGLEVALTAVVDGCMAAAIMTCMVTSRKVRVWICGRAELWVLHAGVIVTDRGLAWLSRGERCAAAASLLGMEGVSYCYPCAMEMEMVALAVGAVSMGGKAGLLREGACWGSTSFDDTMLPLRVLCVPCHEHVGSYLYYGHQGMSS